MSDAPFVNGETEQTGSVSAGTWSVLPDDFDVLAWTRAACEASGVPFAVEDPVALAKLRDLVEHPA